MSFLLINQRDEVTGDLKATLDTGARILIIPNVQLAKHQASRDGLIVDVAKSIVIEIFSKQAQHEGKIGSHQPVFAECRST